MTGSRWEWDPSLYRGSAPYYARGRVAYPDELAGRLAAALDLDGSGRLLDVGCGPGSLILLLAPLFEEATGSTPTTTCSVKPLATRRGPDCETCAGDTYALSSFRATSAPTG